MLETSMSAPIWSWAIPLTNSIHKKVPTHMVFTSAGTGLPSDSAARAEDVTVIRKDNLVEPCWRLRQIGGAHLPAWASHPGSAWLRSLTRRLMPAGAIRRHKLHSDFGTTTFTISGNSR